MRAAAHLAIVGIGLALAGCQATSTSSPEDASQPSDVVSDKDTAAAAPDLGLADSASASELATSTNPLVADAPSDLATPDLLVTTDTAPVKPPDASAPDAARDSASLAADSSAPDATRDATAPATDLATFCTGGASRMVVNGIASNPTVTGQVIQLECCDAGEFRIATDTFDQPIVVSWQALAGAFSGFKTFDLASPPSGWSVRVDVGCAPTAAGCSAPADSYTAGLVGSLALTIGKRAMYDMSICLHVEESASSPHPVVHTLDLFATHIDAD